MFTMLDSVFGIPGEFAPILGGIGLILTAILNPEGIAGGFRLADRNDSSPDADRRSRDDRRRRMLAVGVARGGRAMTLLDDQRDERHLRRPARRRRRRPRGPARASSSGSSARTGPARRPSSTASPASCRPAGASTSTARTSPRVPAHQRSPPRSRPHLAVAGAVRRPDDQGEPAGRRRAPVVEGLPARLRPADAAARPHQGRLRPRRARHRAISPTGCPSEISQGQRKLVSAARALAAQPKLVCMDEPAAGLDTEESLELGAALATDHRCRHDDLPRRPRHGARAQHLRLHLRDRVRPQDRRGHTGRRSSVTRSSSPPTSVRRRRPRWPPRTCRRADGGATARRHGGRRP